MKIDSIQEHLDKIINILSDAKGSIAFINDPAIERTCNKCDKRVIFMTNPNNIQALDETEIFINDSVDELIWLKEHLNESL
tara:strand:- start:891 stop:1133 length:243 start_codon:yes stop_codon:yes gene_type:complete